ncbi:hypothetical protein [Serinicoccus kebangsaanensis]|uniref:hypothetical protein n=1 Tax=Serinicoccus kebangsaanensis TaxID=2602069 RepID=UPI00124DA1F0|nr:hypothetical protein [Serinicoccus kebangsaanensis]
MSDPADIPFQDDERPEESIYEGERPASSDSAGTGASAAGPGAGQDSSGTAAGATPLGQLAAPEETETDVLAGQVTGPEDHEGMAALWRATMDLPHWWFIAVGEPGAESPAAAQIDGQLMLLTYTSGERARHFAVQNEMVGADEDLRAIALPPQELVESVESYQQAGIAGLMFDPHLTGYFMPCDQLEAVWGAVHDEDDPPDAAPSATSS